MDFETCWLVFKIFLVAYPAFMLYRAFIQTQVIRYNQSELRGENILFVIAHPDDEAMFFVPTIANLRQQNKLYLLCLSNGNFAGLGKVREKELVASCRRLGFTETPHCVDDVSLQDGMASVWTEDAVADQIHRFIRAHPEVEFSTIVTFDEKGVSSHPNHISTFKGVLHFLSKK